jgi:hypothetical protein
MGTINFIASVLFCYLYFCVGANSKIENLYLGLSLVYFLLYQIELVLNYRKK